MRDDSAEYGRVIRGMRPQFGVEVLQLYLLAPEIIAEASKLGALVFFAFLIVEGVCGAY